MSERMERSTRSLESLYTVVIGVALSIAVVTLVGEKGIAGVTVESLMLFGAFIVTLFPFYQGALRHLDETYLRNEATKDGALVFDFILLFAHALAFVFLSLLLKKPGQFLWVLVAILGIDVLWGVLAYLMGPSRKAAELKWACINVVFVAFATTFLVWQGIFLQELAQHVRVAVVVLVACMLRTIWDYAWCRDFYFPK